MDASHHGTSEKQSWKGWHILASVAVAVGIVSIGVPFTRSTMPSAVPPDPTPASAGSAQVEIRADDQSQSGAPGWYRTRDSGWASDGSRTVTFAVDADDEIRVWMKRVRPTLAIRCLGRDIEAYVVTEGASSIEPKADRHTVRVAFDAGGFRTEQWLDSNDHRELFAADGQAVARNIAAAGRMRFGYTPFNASPVIANFDVRGFAGPLEEITRTCRQSVTHAASRASRH